MKQKNDGEKPHYLRLALAGVGILLLLALNYLYFREKTSSNSELITRYTRKADPMEKYRNPAVAGLFYAAAPQTLDREVSGYLQAAGGAYEKMPKMLIVPHAGYQYSAPAPIVRWRRWPGGLKPLSCSGRRTGCRLTDWLCLRPTGLSRRSEKCRLTGK